MDAPGFAAVLGTFALRLLMKSVSIIGEINRQMNNLLNRLVNRD